MIGWFPGMGFVLFKRNCQHERFARKAPTSNVATSTICSYNA